VSENIVSGSDWLPLRGVERRRLSEARLQAHHALQWLARAARAYVPPQPDDGHTNLGWDGALGGFTTHPFKNGDRLSLQMTDLTLAWRDSAAGVPVQTFSLDGRPDMEARHWLAGQLGARGLDAKALDAPSPYEIPAHAVDQGAPYAPAGVADALAELAAWFGNAGISLGLIQEQMSARKLTASPVRCWPHHFDLATLITVPARNAGATGSVGAGLSPGDDYYDEPYFYISVYPEPDPKMLPTLPMFGHWHDRDFIAAVATADKIVAAASQQAETDQFLGAAVQCAIGIVG
jgi:hypothetical protein